MKMYSPLKTWLSVLVLLFVMVSCKKDDPVTPTPERAPSAYWVTADESDQYRIQKGPSVAGAGAGSIQTLYTRPVHRMLWYMALRPGTADIYWCEVEVDGSKATSFLYKGDTLGSAPVLVFSRPNLFGNIAVHPVTGDIYWAQYEEADAHDYLYRCRNDGSGMTKLYTTRGAVAAVEIKMDVVNNRLYFIEAYLENAGWVYPKFRICRGPLDGSGMPEILYDLSDLPITPHQDDRLNGLAINGNDLYVSLHAFHFGQMNYIFKGKADGTGPVSVLVQSVPGSASNPLESPLGISLDKSGTYLYWNNQDYRGTNPVTYGSLYRASLTGSATAEKVLTDIGTIPGMYAPLCLGE